MELKEWDRAIETLMPITEDYLYATPHYPHFLIGQAYYHKEDFQHAEEHFEACQDLQPNFPFAAHWLGKTYLAGGQPEKAVSVLEKAVNLSPAAVFQLDLSRAYARTGNYQKARQALGKAQSLATDSDLKEEIIEERRKLQEKACQQ